MKRLLMAGLLAATSIALGGVFYSTVLIDTGLQQAVAWTLGAFAGAVVYLLGGLAERRFLPSGRPPQGPFIRSIVAPSSGLWQVLRLGLAGFCGVLASAVAANALFDPLWIRLVSVVFTAGVVTALSVGFSWYRISAPRLHNRLMD